MRKENQKKHKSIRVKPGLRRAAGRTIATMPGPAARAPRGCTGAAARRSRRRRHVGRAANGASDYRAAVDRYTIPGQFPAISVPSPTDAAGAGSPPRVADPPRRGGGATFNDRFTNPSGSESPFGLQG